MTRNQRLIIMKNILMAMLWVSCFVLALSAPYIDIKVPLRAFVGYMGAFGFFGFAMMHAILFFRSK